MYALYNAVLILSLPFLSLLLLASRHRKGIRARMGFVPAVPADGRRTIWIHAVSVGEAMAAAPLVDAVRERHPSDRIVVTTVTETGQQVARSLLKKADLVTYFPFDFPWSVASAIRRIGPSCVILLETEIWPNLLRALRRRLIPVVIANGRISDRSFRRYTWITFFLRSVLDLPCRFLMQTQRDAERIMRLGAAPDRVIVTGNMKYDRAPPGAGPEDAEHLRTALGLKENQPVLVAGSTHAGEEEAVLASWKEARREFPDLFLVLAPRHPERIPEVEGLASRMGIGTARWSRASESGGPLPEPVLLVDTVGDLSRFYTLAGVSFVGGSLVPVGGHNLLEPAAAGSPILVGPHTENFREIAELLVTEGAARIVKADEITASLAGLLRDSEARRRMGEAGRRVVSQNAGATMRTLDVIADLIGA